MMLIVATLFALVPFLVSLRLHMCGKCSIWWVLIAPVVGMFVFGLLALFFVFISGDI